VIVLPPRLLLWAAVTAYAGGFGALSVLRHRAFETGRFDLGNMTQAVWSTAHGRPLEATNLFGDQFTRLGAHVDPILALFAPLWLVWPSPELLLTAQAVLVALGALPVYRLARRRLGSEQAALVFALAYLLSPAVQWMTLSEFHAVSLAAPLLLFALLFLDEDRLVAFAVVAGLALLTKEHVGLAIAGLGLWYALTRRPRYGAAVAAAGIAATVLSLAVVVPAFNEGAPSDFGARYEHLGGSPGGLAKTLVTDPLAVVEAAVERRDWTYVFQLLVPVLGLCLLAPLVAAAGVPELALNLLSAATTQTSIHFHYSATIVAAVYGGAVVGAARLGRQHAARVAWLVLAASLASTYALGPLAGGFGLPGGERLAEGLWDVQAHDRTAGRALGVIPGDAPVSASNSLGGHLSERRRVFSFPIVHEARWLALDTTEPSWLDDVRPRAEPRFRRAVARLRTDPSWRLVLERDGVLIFRRR
jgi:uncharacterized membrane protein